MLKNMTETFTEKLLEELQKKRQCVTGGLVKEPGCNKTFRLTGMSGSGG